jgi:uncharacterized membrane protein
MTERGRDWPPDADKPTPSGPPVSSVITLSAIIFLIIGSVLASWFVAVLPGDRPWAPAIVPAGWALALVVFLIGSFINWRRTK